MSVVPPDHQLERTLAPERDGVSLVLCSFQGRRVVTRIFTGSPCALALRPMVEGAAFGRQNQLVGFSDNLQAHLIGYGVRSRLKDFPQLPEVLAAGVASQGMTDQGLPYLSAAWVEGSTLESLARVLSPEELKDALLRVLRLLAELHARLVVFGDLKPSNVVLGDGSLSFIDLETLREVPGPHQPVPAMAVTPDYAAPELRQRLMYLSSDVYSFAAMVRRLLNPSAGPWAELVAAGLRAEPGDRPSASELLALLEAGQALPQGGGTVRILDQELPEPALATPASVPAPDFVELPQAPAAPRPPRRPRRWLLLSALVLLLLAFVGAGVQVMSRIDHANSAAQAVAADLSRRQTSLADNKNISLDDLAVRGAAAASLWPGPYPLAVKALTQVLSSKWHYTSTRWDPARWTLDQAAVNAALEAGDSPEVYLAQTFLYGGACWRMPDSEASARASRCDQAVTSYEALEKALRSRERGWMHIDGTWAVVMTESRQSTRLEATDPLRARLQDHALDRCRSALGVGGRGAVLADLRSAVRQSTSSRPVNTAELAEECLMLAGSRRSYDAYLRYADLYLSLAEAAGGKAAETARLKAVRYVDSSCIESKVSLGRLINGGFVQQERRWDSAAQWRNLCRVVGATAIGCGEEARDLRCKQFTVSWWSGLSSCVEWATDPQVPWESALNAIATPVRTECPL